ncbi:CAMK/CAMK1 protein kinase [Mycena sanguinolenta]|nr:CAMK/CAMK1 protein kinase [Mycena sanguinolenta]
MAGSTTTMPHLYSTGKLLGRGTYAIVKEATHLHTGKVYACKIINKKLIGGKEDLVRNEIAVLKQISGRNPNIVTLHDYFETANNLYMCFDLCSGGELFDRICSGGSYYEADAAALIRTIMTGVLAIHNAGIVHRDLKPENILFRTNASDAEIMIADFGLSRIMDESKAHMLTDVCGTPGYMAPEIFLSKGHGKPVDIYAMGVVTYFLLVGYTPFNRASPKDEDAARIAGTYKFEPTKYWENISEVACSFVRACLVMDPQQRPTAAQALDHPWLASKTPHFVRDSTSIHEGPTDLLPHVRRAVTERMSWKPARFSFAEVKQYQEESTLEILENTSITHQHDPKTDGELTDGDGGPDPNHDSPQPA